MSTVIYPSPVFGPVKSRRLGVSLGINLLPGDGKFCTFDCVYCECGFNADFRPKTPLPTCEEVRKALTVNLRAMKATGEQLDVLTFAGNGEPTAHPAFADIITDTLFIRDTYFPEAKISVLSNATLIRRPHVFNALQQVDNNILKLDTVSPDYIARVNRPTGAYSVEEIIKGLQAFEGQLIVQTLFMKGSADGMSVDNTGDAYVLPWLAAVKTIRPRSVMIYTVDRDTPAPNLEKASPDELNRIVGLLAEAGIAATASY